MAMPADLPHWRHACSVLPGGYPDVFPARLMADPRESPGGLTWSSKVASRSMGRDSVQKDIDLVFFEHICRSSSVWWRRGPHQRLGAGGLKLGGYPPSSLWVKILKVSSKAPVFLLEIPVRDRAQGARSMPGPQRSRGKPQRLDGLHR